MRALLASLALLLAPPLRAGGPTKSGGPPALLPSVSAPLAGPALAPTAFPVRTREQFFGGAQSIVDLGAEAMGPWTIELARERPQARVTAVDINPIEKDIGFIRSAYRTPNVDLAVYDFFDRPEGHPVGDRVVMNSPHFGGLGIRKADEVAEMIDAHMEPGALFYGSGDDLWFLSSAELRWIGGKAIEAIMTGQALPRGVPSVREVSDSRRRALVDALGRRFGRHNVAERVILDYDLDRRLNAAEIHSIQARKPR
jgi:hypothetical protein